MNKFKSLLVLILTSLTISCFAQSPERIDPPCWWTGMKNKTVQLLVYGKNISSSEISVNYDAVKISKIHKAENSDFVFIDLLIESTAKPGNIPIQFSSKSGKNYYNFPLLNRKNISTTGLSSKDLIYMLMVDRFSNGDTKNDKITGMLDQTMNSDSALFRHGGDLSGIINHLDYIKSLGTTALWLTPVFECNQPLESYHGYATTDHYKIDSRFGDNDLYVKFVEQCHQKDIKVIMDVVYNHIGSEHWLYKNLPSKNWIHTFKKFTRTSYRDPVLFDPYVAESDKEIFSNGWFDKHMPDLNQQDTLLANYLIQNSIWWIEYSGIDAFRIDTYAYPDQLFMSRLIREIKNEYPQFGIFGETWVHGNANQAFYAKNSGFKKSYFSQLPGVTDFQLYYAINSALTKDFGWTDGVAALYYCLANDYLYENAYNNVLFLDNHDLSRYYSMVGKDINKYKMGITFLLTTRGIPCIYYGTEILMDGFSDLSGSASRKNFQGGWPNDKPNKFNNAGRTNEENEAYNFVLKLANYRKNNAVLQTGKLMQYVPENGVYVYFRYDENKTIMVILNSNNTDRIIDTVRYAERIKNYSKAKNIITNEIISNLSTVKLPKNSSLALELAQ